MCILQSLQRYLSAVQSLISFLNNSSNLAFLIALRTNSQICEARKAKKQPFHTISSLTAYAFSFSEILYIYPSLDGFHHNTYGLQSPVLKRSI